jgi:lysophospholipase L1-like esterase
MKRMETAAAALAALFLAAPASARPAEAERGRLVVAADGSSPFRTVQAAIDALPVDDATPRTIIIRNGVYREKVYVTRRNLVLVGEDREKTRLEYPELRRNWRAAHPDDWGAAVVNIGPQVSDLVIANLTVHNTYGGVHGDHDHQFAIRSSGDATRIAILHARVLADGGDTLSLWNAPAGLSYAADSVFEGWVDFVCPRGWAYITNSRFVSHSTTASLWHDGSRDRSQKFVVRHSRFEGVPGFALGRNHRDGQIYLLDASFSADMADCPLYPAAAPDPLRWGPRYYYSGCGRDGAPFAWYEDNLETAEGAPREEEVTAAWTFGGRWDPEATLPAVLPFAALPWPADGARHVDPRGVTLRWKPGRDAAVQAVSFGTDERPRAGASEQAGSTFETGPLRPGTTYYWRVDAITASGTVPGPVWRFTAGPRQRRIVLVGDSTVTDGSGWGRGFKAHVGGGAAVANRAQNGRSSKSYAAEGHWARALALRPDYVLLQFGHNDVPGKGPDRETDLPTYAANLARYVDEARVQGALPVIVTSLTRRFFTPEGRIQSDLGGYVEAARRVAAEKDVPLVDLHARSIELLDAMGSERGLALGPRKPDGTLDKTHLNAEGSALFGAAVARELAQVVPQLADVLR